MARIWIICAALLGGGGVAIGAYHAHGLEKKLNSSGFSDEAIVGKMDNCETAVRYQMYHAIALLLIGCLSLNQRGRLLNVVGLLFVLGMIGFSGGLYLDVFIDNMIHWAIIPSGGLLLIIAWVMLAVAGFQLTAKPDAQEN